MTNFVIVIEVDNKQALAAYARGLEDLDRVMPQLRDGAAIIDVEDEDEAARADADYEREMAQYKERMKAYSTGREAWLAWPTESRWTRGKRPDYPDFPIWFPRHRSVYRRYATSSLESVREELVHMLNIAKLATGPYRMTEHQVEEMVSWGDGSRVESIKRNFCKPTTAWTEAGTMKGK